MRRAARRLLIAGWLVGMLAPPALAQQTPAAPGGGPPTSATGGQETGQPVSNEDLRDLIGRLEDPKERERLILDLRALLAARGQEEPSEAQAGEDAMSSLLEAISARTAVVQDVGSSVIAALDQIPQLGAWLRDQLARPERRAVWLDVGSRVALILGCGLLGYVGPALPLRALRARATHPADTPKGALWRLGHLLGWLVLDLLPVIGFAVLALVALALGQAGGPVRHFALPLIYAVVVAHAGIALARVTFAPEAPAVRMVPLGDEAARYGFAWARRLIALAAYGFFALEAARRLGLPWALHGFLLNVLFLAVVAMVAVLILRCRRPVADAIASLAGEQHPRALRRLPWPALARIWHLPALAYVLLVYLVWALEVPGGFEVVLRATIGSALVIGATWLVLRLIAAAFPGATAPVEQVEAPVSVAGGRVRRYLPVARIVVRVLVLAIAGLALLEIWGLGSLRWLASDAGERFSGQLLTVAAIIVVTLIVWEIISLLIERSIGDTDAEGNLRLSSRTRTLLTIIRNFVLVFLSLIALF
ncbi:MAG: hypothetical protein ACREH6_12765, partial [Geminicoccaceae bacterium]